MVNDPLEDGVEGDEPVAGLDSVKRTDFVVWDRTCGGQ